ncbi:MULTISPECIES: GumC family protein [Thalassospira]|uniref:AAA domain-containing protein n=2 Tax=Thalassospira TaxID=168934 RepID=A0A367WBT6_9PROT|nr:MULTISPECIES: polysaccharide biosynthesis tyrosine autokinase [Thalassospira]MDG4718166.1 polysaccharide biosynthesis tyrosine autokinase [Thalassospira sp. FZY0004]RCK37930.1 hypothetical protein TH19_07880 [Thalassospira profundimaris]
MKGDLPDTFDPSLRDLIAIIWQRRGVALLAFAVVMAAFLGLLANWKSDYRAIAEIGLAPVSAPLRSDSKESLIAQQGQLTAQQIETAIAELRSEETLAAVLAVLRGEEILTADHRGVGDVIRAIFSAQNTPAPKPGEAQLMERLRGGLVAERVGNSAVIEVSFAASDPVMSQLVLQTIVESYVWQREDRQKRSLRTKLEEASIQLEASQTELEEHERNLAEWQQQAGMLDADEGKLMLDRIYALDEQVEKIGQDVAGFKLAAKRRDTASRLEDLLSIPDVATHPLVSQLSERYDAQKQEFIALDQRYGPKHPLMLGRQSELDAQRQQLYEAAQTVAAQIGDALANAEEKLRLITRQRDQWQARISERNASMQGQATLLREVAMARDNTRDLGQQVQLLRRDLASFRGDTEILRSAALPTSAEFPGKRDLMMLAVMAALFCAIIAAVLRHYFDQTIGDDFDPETMLGIPLYARIPAIRSDRSSEKMARIRDEAIGHLAILMRIIDQQSGDRTNPETGQVIAIGSAQSGEGKSYIAHALAEKLAGLGSKVLLIDADLLDPAQCDGTVAQFADLTGVLSGQADIPDIARDEQSDGSYLHLGVRMAVPGNIATGLIETGLGPLIGRLRERFDHIILDTPPVLSIADGVVALRLADVRLFAIRQGNSKKRDIRDALDQLRTAGVMPEGIVLNGVQPRPAYGKGHDVTARGGQIT